MSRKLLLAGTVLLAGLALVVWWRGRPSSVLPDTPPPGLVQDCRRLADVLLMRLRDVHEAYERIGEDAATIESFRAVNEEARIALAELELSDPELEQLRKGYVVTFETNARAAHDLSVALERKDAASVRGLAGELDSLEVSSSTLRARIHSRCSIR